MSSLSSAGNLSVSSNLTVGGTTTLSGQMTSTSGIIATALTSNTLTLANNLTQTGGSISSGSGGIIANGNIIGNANQINYNNSKFNTVDISGNSNFYNTLTNYGNTKLNNVDISGNAIIYGTTTLNSTVALNANIIANSTVITPTEISYLDNISQNISSAITALQQKTTKLSYSGFTITTIADELQVGDKLQVGNVATFNGGLITNQNMTCASGTTLILNSNISANGTTITPTELSYLDTVSSNIQTQLNTQTTNISTLQTKCTDLTHSGTTNTMANNFVVSGNTTANGDFTCGGGGKFLCGTGGTFPTTSNSITAGTGLFWNYVSGQGESDLLNYSQGGVGGFNFYRVNATNAPTLLAQIDSSGRIISSGATYSGLVTCSNGLTCTSGNASFKNTKINGVNASANGNIEFLNYLGSSQALLFPSAISNHFKISSYMPNGIGFDYGGTLTFSVDNSGNGVFANNMTSTTVYANNISAINANLVGTLTCAKYASNYTTSWFAVNYDTSYTITHSLAFTMANPIKVKVFYSDVASPVLGTNLITDITGQFSSYFLQHTDSNNIALRTRSFVATYYSGSLQNVSTGYYKIFVY